MVAPLAEIGFIVLLYAVVEPAQKAALVEKVSRVPIESLQTAMSTSGGYIAITAGAAVVLLCLTIASKAVYGYLQAEYLFHSYIIQSRRVLAAYLSATPARAMILDRTRVANVAVIETGLYGIDQRGRSCVVCRRGHDDGAGPCRTRRRDCRGDIRHHSSRVRTSEETGRSSDTDADVAPRPCVGDPERLSHHQDRGR
jgi:hypothetical protein